MRIFDIIQDDRIDDNTIVIIKDLLGGPAICGRWYDNKILMWGNSDASFDFVEERNIAILQLL